MATDVFILLDAWGEWERCGSGFLKQLDAKSPMQLCMDSVLPVWRSFGPSMSDEQALGFGRVLLQLKSVNQQMYWILHFTHVCQWSTRRIALFMDLNRIEALKIYERAVGWVEGNLDSRMAA
jgi:hypothetical protein